jgi:hypothetical protein
MMTNYSQEDLLRLLHPIVELTVNIRPRLLLVASSVHIGPLWLGVLYDCQKNAFQSRLRFQESDSTEFLRRTKWRPVADQQTFLAQQTKILADFSTLVRAIGAELVVQLEFVATASDDEITQMLMESSLLILFV